MTTRPLTDGELADRIVAAVSQGLQYGRRFAAADPDSAGPEDIDIVLSITGAVLEVVQPELDRLRAELATAPSGAPLTCAASEANSFGVVGPCILRFRHDGPVHQDAAGAKWWLTTRFATGTVGA